MLTLYDAVNAANIPANAGYVAYYTDGRFANGTAIKARFPHAIYLSITVFGGIADCCDCEQGDLTVAHAEAWVAQRLAAGAYRPCVYSNLDRWQNQGLEAGLAKYGNRIRRWVAHFDDIGQIPSGFDAKQYSTNPAVDVSVCLPNFFDPRPLPKPPAPPSPDTPYDQAFNQGFNAGFRSGFQDGFNAGWTAR